jgi:hypothetical protein
MQTRHCDEQREESLPVIAGSSQRRFAHFISFYGESTLTSTK